MNTTANKLSTILSRTGILLFILLGIPYLINIFYAYILFFQPLIDTFSIVKLYGYSDKIILIGSPLLFVIIGYKLIGQTYKQSILSGLKSMQEIRFWKYILMLYIPGHILMYMCSELSRSLSEYAILNLENGGYTIVYNLADVIYLLNRLVYVTLFMIAIIYIISPKVIEFKYFIKCKREVIYLFLLFIIREILVIALSSLLFTYSPSETTVLFTKVTFNNLFGLTTDILIFATALMFVVKIFDNLNQKQYLEQDQYQKVSNVFEL